MSNIAFSKNIMREYNSSRSFLDQLKTTHAVADNTPAARWTRSQIEERYRLAHEAGTHLGYAEGYARGEANGLEIGLEAGISQVRQESEAAHQEAIAAFAQDLNATLERAQQGVDQWYSDAEQKLAVLAIEIAQRAISQELSINQEAVLQIAKQVLNEVTTGSHVRLRVNPVQTAILDSRREEILQSISHLRNIEVIADPNISDGLIVESDSGVIDARIETYLQRLTDQVTGEAA